MQSVEGNDIMLEKRAQIIGAIPLLQADDRISFIEILGTDSDLLCLQIAFAGADISLYHATPQSSRIDLEVELGPVPAKDFREFSLQLLELNAALASSEEAGVGVDVDRKAVVYRCRHDVSSGVEFNALLKKLDEIADFSFAWFDEWFPSAAEAMDALVEDFRI